MTEQHLSHHGILGTKWGVRRYQNEDSSLTPAGRERYAHVATDPRKQKRDTKDAIKVLGQKAKEYQALEDIYKKRANKTEDPEKKSKYSEKEMASRAIKDIMLSKLDDISQEKIKAGKDFIVQRDLNIYTVLPFGIIGSVERTIIEKSKD